MTIHKIPAREEVICDELMCKDCPCFDPRSDFRNIGVAGDGYCRLLPPGTLILCSNRHWCWIGRQIMNHGPEVEKWLEDQKSGG